MRDINIQDLIKTDEVYSPKQIQKILYNRRLIFKNCLSNRQLATKINFNPVSVYSISNDSYIDINLLLVLKLTAYIKEQAVDNVINGVPLEQPETKLITQESMKLILNAIYKPVDRSGLSNNKVKLKTNLTYSFLQKIRETDNFKKISYVKYLRLSDFLIDSYA